MNQLSQFIMNHWPLSLAFVVILFLLFLNEWIAQKKKAKELTPQAAVNQINHERAVVIDLRDKESFNKGHIVDSIQATEEDFEQQKMKKYQKKILILVCLRGTHSAKVAAKINTQGYQAQVLAGGITAWKDANLPLINS